ncbi:MAG: hypothetical protein V9E81_10500 [Marmoricola sp.]|jgi:hypothetical protein
MLQLISMLTFLADPTPTADETVAGPWGAVVIVSLIIATFFLLRSFTKQLRKVNAADLPSKKEQSAQPPSA